MSQLRIETTDIPGLHVVHLGLQHNDDGWFKEGWHREKMTALGLPDFTPVQHNVTHVVSRGITRGFHAEPWDRLASVVRGRAMGAWVDLRPGDGFGRTFTCDLDPGTSVFIPRGVANAFQVLEDDTTFTYLLDHHWTPQARERSAFVHLFDPALGIGWPIGRDRAIVAHRDDLHPLLADVTPMQPRRTLVAGAETRLGRALLAELPGAEGVATEELDPATLDLSAYDVLVNAHGDTGTGLAAVRHEEPWTAAAARAQRLADIARRHSLRYVHLSADPAFERDAPEHDEADVLSLDDPHTRGLAVAEAVAAGVPRHLIVRTGWVLGGGDGFLHDVATAARRGTRIEVVGDRHGRLTFASQLAAGITHLLDTAAPEGTYHLTGDGRVVTWTDVARRIVDIVDGRPGTVVEVPAGPDVPAGGVLGLDRIKATGFRPGNAWLELIDHLPKVERPHAAAAAPAPAPEPQQERGPYRVLFVCTANICRSAYADVVAQRLAPEGVVFTSAGTRALVDQGIDPPMAAHVVDGTDIDRHRARQLTRDLMAEADLALTMAADHRRYILDEWPALGRKAFVIGHVAREMARLPDDVTLDGLVDHLWRHRSSEPGDEVADPYRRGDDAAMAAARTIDDALASIMGGLRRLVGVPGAGGQA